MLFSFLAAQHTTIEDEQEEETRIDTALAYLTIETDRPVSLLSYMCRAGQLIIMGANFCSTIKMLYTNVLKRKFDSCKKVIIMSMHQKNHVNFFSSRPSWL